MAVGEVMRVTFLLPLPGTHPIGGFKVVYEYANYLAGRGHTVSVVHPAIFRKDQGWRTLGWKARAKTVRAYLTNKLTGRYRPGRWFKVAPEVRLLWVPSLAERWVPDGDAVVATAWETAEWAAEYGAGKGKKFYLIQHLETWSGPEDRVLATWRMPLEKIVIAEWLRTIAEEMGERAQVIHNGLDFECFHVTKPIAGRDASRVLMLFHNLQWKGTADGLRAFALAKEQVPGLRLTMFGLSDGDGALPEGVEFHHNPTQERLRELYNEAAVFVSPSWTEGFGLPAAEALQCGAAIAVTDIPGSAAYARHEETALLSPAKEPAALAENIVRLARDGTLRERLATAGNKLIGEFTWERAGSEFEEALRGGPNHGATAAAERI